MATPASADAVRYAGNIRFLIGGLYTADLIGAFVKDISEQGVVTLQMPDGSEATRNIGVSTGLETYMLPSRTSASLATGAIGTLTWTLDEIQAVDPTFDEPTGEYLLAAALADHSVFQVVHAGWRRDQSQGRSHYQARSDRPKRCLHRNSHSNRLEG